MKEKQRHGNDLLSRKTIEQAARAATELLAPIINRRPTVITIDRTTGKVKHRLARKLTGSKAFKETVQAIAGL